MVIAISEQTISIHVPSVADAAGMDELVRECPPLDTNSRYLYLLLAHHYAQTCAVAHMGDKLVGVLTGYLPPNQPDAYFVWQVAVHSDARGQRLAGRMIEHVLERPTCKDVRFIEATVSPSNTASRRLFEKLAEQFGTRCDVSPLFGAELFGSEAHEEEQLLRVGPIR